VTNPLIPGPLDKCHPKAQVLKDWSPVCDTIERWWKV
jgi:hypothetical protein